MSIQFWRMFVGFNLETHPLLMHQWRRGKMPDLGMGLSAKRRTPSICFTNVLLP